AREDARHPAAARQRDTVARVALERRQRPLPAPEALAARGRRAAARLPPAGHTRPPAARRHQRPARADPAPPPRSGRAGAGVPEPARLRAELLVPELRLAGGVPALRAADDAAPQARSADLPPLRRTRAPSARLPRLQPQRPDRR